jgi:uncharacterized glyoxalase superfamily protein PhnB
MIHVPDVRATMEWYQSLDFEVINTNERDGRIDFALLSFGEGSVMFSEGGKRSSEFRREVDLYVHVENVEDLHCRIKDRVEIVEDLHDTFYGAREFIVRDLNGFWITFGQDSGAN